MSQSKMMKGDIKILKKCEISLNLPICTYTHIIRFNFLYKRELKTIIIEQ